MWWGKKKEPKAPPKMVETAGRWYKTSLCKKCGTGGDDVCGVCGSEEFKMVIARDIYIYEEGHSWYDGKWSRLEIKGPATGETVVCGYCGRKLKDGRCPGCGAV